MSRIESDHLAREAIVYVRQSTIDQVINNVESRRRQYGLVERARQLGWANVSVIDDDLGRSGSGVSRPGFEKLLAAICEGRVGAVVSIEASRLARNGRDWHTLLEFCGLVGTLIADEDGVYDPRLPNDRLLLGMKGTMSEMELSILRQRAHEALTAGALPSTMGPNAASHSAVFASTPQSPARSSSAFSLSASKRRWRLFRNVDAKTPRSADRSTSRSSKLVSRLRTLDGNMTLSIPTTGWSPANWSGAGTNA